MLITAIYTLSLLILLMLTAIISTQITASTAFIVSYVEASTNNDEELHDTHIKNLDKAISSGVKTMIVVGILSIVSIILVTIQYS